VAAEDLVRAHLLVTQAAGPQTQIEGETITAPVKDPELMPAVVRTLDREGIAVGELALRRSSLDEVFLVLTGHRAEPGEPEKNGGAAVRDDDESEREKAVSRS
jgi:oleandomycin transport system ATP-binding protein